MKSPRHAVLAAAVAVVFPAMLWAGDGLPDSAPLRIGPGTPSTVALRVREAVPLIKGAYLGISASPASQQLRSQLELPDGMGLVVEVIMPDSPAATAGLKRFDVLQKFDDQLLVNPQQLAVLVRSHKPGDEIKLTVIRQGKSQVVPARLVEHELEPLVELDGMPEQMRRVLPEPTLRPLFPGGPFQLQVQSATGGAASYTLIDGDRSYTINTDPAGHKTFVVKDKDGNSVFDGLIDTPDQRANVPADLKPKLEHMEQMAPTIKLEATTKPEEKK